MKSRTAPPFTPAVFDWLTAPIRPLLDAAGIRMTLSGTLPAPFDTLQGVTGVSVVLKNGETRTAWLRQTVHSWTWNNEPERRTVYLCVARSAEEHHATHETLLRGEVNRQDPPRDPFGDEQPDAASPADQFGAAELQMVHPFMPLTGLPRVGLRYLGWQDGLTFISAGPGAEPDGAEPGGVITARDSFTVPYLRQPDVVFALPGENGTLLEGRTSNLGQDLWVNVPAYLAFIRTLRGWTRHPELKGVRGTPPVRLWTCGEQVLLGETLSGRESAAHLLRGEAAPTP